LLHLPLHRGGRPGPVERRRGHRQGLAGRGPACRAAGAVPAAALFPPCSGLFSWPAIDVLSLVGFWIALGACKPFPLRSMATIRPLGNAGDKSARALSPSREELR